MYKLLIVEILLLDKILEKCQSKSIKSNLKVNI